MDREAKIALLAVRRAFRKGPNPYLWNILSALRGPDHEGSYDTKLVTTAIIRSRLLGKDVGRNTGVVFNSSDTHAEDRRSLSMSIHFLRHARYAFDALGLKWDENNYDIKPISLSVRAAKKKSEKGKSSASIGSRKGHRSGTRAKRVPKQ